ncbi:MAG: class I SAM-dependent methyltransferase [Rhodocyclaceae bacterium]|nr:class I SAM-dependent methyltransferase [Rhodocyclaceae bacterium]
MTATLKLLAGKDKSIKARHPWIFAGSVSDVSGRAKPGDTVDVVASNGRPLARAAWSPESQIRARVWTFDPNETIDHAFFKRRIAAAIARRDALPELRAQQGLRLIHAESDGLPGITADRYGDTVVVALTSAGAEKWRAAIIDSIYKASGCARIYERSDASARSREGLAIVTGWCMGEAPVEALVIEENGVRMSVDIVAGHKTGFYLDQRDNRRRVGELSANKRVLNCFCYTGGFSLQALKGGASEVISVDSSGPALATAQHNLALNPQLDATSAIWHEADVFADLRARHNANEKFDLIILDPPKFAPSAAHAERAARAYKDINLQAMKCLNPGGMLMSYSCSGGISVAHFQQIIADAATDAARTTRIVQRLQGAADHPVDVAFPEGEYLKGLLLQLD